MSKKNVVLVIANNDRMRRVFVGDITDDEKVLYFDPATNEEVATMQVATQTVTIPAKPTHVANIVVPLLWVNIGMFALYQHFGWTGLIVGATLYTLATARFLKPYSPQ